MSRTEYDAFVIYNPVRGDQDFVRRMTAVMEAPPYSLKLFDPWRYPAHQEDHYVTMDYIQNKCRKCIVLLTNNFAGCQNAEFQLKYASSLTPANLFNHVIPICLEKCSVPEVLRYVYALPYYKTETRPWFWQRLYKALTMNSDENEQKVKAGVSLPDVVLESSQRATTNGLCPS